MSVKFLIPIEVPLYFNVLNKFSWFDILADILGEPSKKGYFTVRLTIRGGGPFGYDRKQMWKFWPIYSIKIWFLYTQGTFALIVRGLKNATFTVSLSVKYPFLDDSPVCKRVVISVMITEDRQPCPEKLVSGLRISISKWIYTWLYNQYHSNRLATQEITQSAVKRWWGNPCLSL